MKEKNNRILNLILTTIPIVCILLVWQIEAKKINNEFILTDVGVTFKALVEILKQQEFYKSLWGTLSRTLIAFGVSFVMATVLAFLSRISKKAEVMIVPVISIIRSLPTIAIILLLYIWTDSSAKSAIIVTTLVVLPTTYSSMRDAFFTVDDELIKGLKLYKVPTHEMLLKVYFPQILPSTLLAIGGGIALNLKLMVAAEVIVSTANSLGYLLNTSKAYFDIASMIAVVVVSVAIGLIVESTFRFVSKKVGKWQ
ncbi:MAG: ABC transporter permease subunit [Clostridia bacterium]|nr:ABC transporter permease subunit [Clostridia bacterium]